MSAQEPLPRDFKLEEDRRYRRRDGTITKPLIPSASIVSLRLKEWIGQSWLVDQDTGFEYDPSNKLTGHFVYPVTSNPNPYDLVGPAEAD